MSIIIYHNPRCSKSRRTLELLEQHRQQPQIIEYLKTPPDANTLKQLLVKLKITARDLLRSNETEYKLLGLDNQSLSDDEIIAGYRGEGHTIYFYDFNHESNTWQRDETPQPHRAPHCCYRKQRSTRASAGKSP